MIGAELLRSIVAVLESAGVPFMLTGSVAAAYYGAGRSTMDIDLVIDPQRSQLQALVAGLAAPGTYVSMEAALEALEHQSMFNVVDASTGWKADLIMRKSRPFSESEFGRRIPITFEGAALFVATAEDVIVSKLEWAKLSGSMRQLEDVAALLRARAGQLDQAYLDRWIGELALDDQWRQVNR